MRVALQLVWKARDRRLILLRRQLDVDWPGIPRIGDTLVLDLRAEHDWKVQSVSWHLDGGVTLYLGELNEGTFGDRVYPPDFLETLRRAGFSTTQ